MFKHSLIALCAAMFFSTNAQNATNIPYSLYAGLPFQMEQVKAPAFPANVVSITDFGAKGDGKTDNTQAFAKAIEALVSKGGGTVEIPAGTWITGTHRTKKQHKTAYRKRHSRSIFNRQESLPHYQSQL
jgi:Endopolygalacturonase